MKIVGFSSPPLAKFCPAEFNIKKGCNTVRFGTLFDYRTEENEKLRDEGEGTFSYSIDFPELTKVSPQWLGAFELENDGHCEIREMEFSGSEFSVKSISLKGSSHNCWIYCMSKSTESAGNITDTHQDKWLLPVEKLSDFSKYLGAILWEEITAADLPETITSKYSMQEIHRRISLEVECRQIEYGSRSINITKEEDLPVSEISRLRDNVAFMKPDAFEKENEMRIAFWLLFDNKKVSIVNRPKVVGLRPIDRLI